MLLGKRITQRILLNHNSPITTYQKYTLAMARVKRRRVTGRKGSSLQRKGRGHKPVRISRHRRSKAGLRWRQSAHKKISRGRSQVQFRNSRIARGKTRKRNPRGRGGGRGGGGGGGGGRRGRRNGPRGRANAGVLNSTKAVGFPSSFNDVFRAEQRYK